MNNMCNFDVLRTLTENLREPLISISEFDNLTRHIMELTVLKQIVNVIRDNSDEEMYGKVLDIILKVMESEIGGFGYIEKETGDFIEPSLTRHVWEKCQVKDKNIRFLAVSFKTMSTWGKVFNDKVTCYSNVSLKVPKGHISINRILIVPIIFRTSLIGMFAIANKKDDYNSADIELLELIANYIAPVLNARLQRDGIR